MTSGLVFALLLCLSCGLWMAGEASCIKPIPKCRCPSGWSQYGRRCFLFNNYERDWATAERICIGNGANLASFHSSSEYQFLKNLVNSKKGSYVRTWVGGNDAAKDGVWMWTDGSRFSYTRWGKGEPNNTGGRESCMEINLRGSSLHLNDEKCSRKSYFICAKDL
ncbi:PREDICTED: ladderlectin-like [Cyprinodon variegatus]|nr:PREDICTED: ladderlectin-like [Cyprinodon variegatus]